MNPFFFPAAWHLCSSWILKHSLTSFAHRADPSKSLHVWTPNLSDQTCCKGALAMEWHTAAQQLLQFSAALKRQGIKATGSLLLLRMRGLKATESVVLSFSPLLCDNSITFSLYSTIQWVCIKEKETVLPQIQYIQNVYVIVKREPIFSKEQNSTWAAGAVLPLLPP